MNSKQMQRWAGIFLLISTAALIYGIAVDNYRAEIFYFLIVSTIFNVSSEIMKKLESFESNK